MSFCLFGDEEGSKYLYVINPYEVASFQSNRIATPHVLRIQLSNVDVLQDDILSTHDAETFTLDDARRSRSDQGLV